ncbi:MAG TPA: PKD domain-containing protein [Cyclobacteriaceae bacterium]|nr:PKD domain-containing protein [Cyclobacteriaceae bacterium]
MRLVFSLLLISFHAIAQNNQGLRFIQNKGQWDKEIDFQAQVPGGRLGVSAKGFSVLLLDLKDLEQRHLANHGEISESSGHHAPEPVNGHFFRINLLGANHDSKPVVKQPLDGYDNYFIGNDSTKWATNALAFASVVYPNIYPGIDFRVSSVGKNLKYDFIVGPGADPSQIKIEYDGVNSIDKSGEGLAIQTAVGSLTELKPYSYQVIDDEKRTVPSSFRLRENMVSFSLPAEYDRERELVIDPILIFSTYSGSTADNWGSTATPGEHGTLYSAGVTHQGLGGFFPATPGSFQLSNHGNFDMAVIKYDSAGTRFIYATHLGGVNNDSPESLVVDKASGDLIVLGISSSPDYPTSASSFDRSFNFGTTIFNRVLDTNDQWDIVVTRLSSAGNHLVGSTFLGGSGNDGLNLPKQSGGPLVVNYGDEMRGDVITDETGNVFISSVTSSGDFPIVNGFDNSFNGGITDGLVVKLTPDLSSIVWSTYVGGSGFDAAYSIKFDNNNNLVLAGGTTSIDFPTTVGAHQTTFNGIVDGWIARLAADGTAILNATYTGTNSFDQVYFVDLNANGNVFCYGQTAGHMPVTPGVYYNPNSGQFLQKFSPDLSTLEFSTVFGSSSSSGLVIPNISPTAFLVNDCNNIYMAGWGGFVNSSPSTGFWQSSTIGMPITTDAYQKTTSGSDFYFMVLNGDASTLVYSTYLGGTLSKTHVDGGTSRFDKYGIVYHAVCSGCAFGSPTNSPSSDFPTTPNAKSRVNLSLNCNNAAFKFDLSSLKAMFQTNSLDLTKPGFNNVCYPDTIVFQNISTGGRNIIWDFGDGTTVTQTNTDVRSVTHQYKQTGKYNVKLKIIDLSTCSQTDSTVQVINYFKNNIVAGGSVIVCEGNSLQLTASGGTSYQWTSLDKTFTSTLQSPVVYPKTGTLYFITVVDANGCSKSDTVSVGVVQNVHAFFQTYNTNFSQSGYNNACFPDSLRFKNLSVNGEDFTWDFNDGTILSKTKDDTVSFFHKFQQPGTYKVKLISHNIFSCNKYDTTIHTINYFKANIKVGDDAEICEGNTLQLTASGGILYSWTSDDHTFNSSIATPVVRPSLNTKYFVTVIDANNCFRKDTIIVTIIDSVALKWRHLIQGNCVGRPSVHVQNLSNKTDVNFTFDFGDGTTSHDTEVDHVYQKDGTYLIKLIAQNKTCSYEEATSLPIYTAVIPNVFTPDATPDYNDYFKVLLGPNLVAPAAIDVKVQLTVVDRWGKEVFKSLDYKNDWDGHGLPPGVYYMQAKVGDVANCKDWLQIIR